MPPPTIIYKNAGNWVDRGEPPNAMARNSSAHGGRVGRLRK
ncbi:MAG TPA: hypothetical protein VM099_13980 [Gemmatimonadaceae bacterium]|nr:hypothetical protein [Gemmatimonadaceae bacterium]